MKPYGHRMGANDYDRRDEPVSVVLKSRARDEDDEAVAEGLEDYDWLDAPIAGLHDAPERMSVTPCKCGQPRLYRKHACESCRVARAAASAREYARRATWRCLSPSLTLRTCACGIVFALKHEEPKCSICRARPCDRRDMKVKECPCGARFAAKGKQSWCDGCRLKVREVDSAPESDESVTTTTEEE